MRCKTCGANFFFTEDCKECEKSKEKIGREMDNLIKKDELTEIVKENLNKIKNGKNTKTTQ